MLISFASKRLAIPRSNVTKKISADTMERAGLIPVNRVIMKPMKAAAIISNLFVMVDLMSLRRVFSVVGLILFILSCVFILMSEVVFAGGN